MLIETGWWYTYPSEKYESQLGSLFPIYGKIKAMFQTTNQEMKEPKGYGWHIVLQHRKVQRVVTGSINQDRQDQPRFANEVPDKVTVSKCSPAAEGKRKHHRTTNMPETDVAAPFFLGCGPMSRNNCFLWYGIETKDDEQLGMIIVIYIYKCIYISIKISWPSQLISTLVKCQARFMN